MLSERPRHPTFDSTLSSALFSHFGNFISEQFHFDTISFRQVSFRQVHFGKQSFRQNAISTRILPSLVKICELTAKCVSLDLVLLEVWALDLLNMLIVSHDHEFVEGARNKYGSRIKLER